ncbi:phage tail protein [Streptomyces orinoci]|uniref:Phage tail protein n=1 Tax=Streptomyces orinoci TaxID=67339 RepID=A0ABV3K0V5_STRON|nr:phage tail protein [Streptomyces orinoci]
MAQDVPKVSDALPAVYAADPLVKEFAKRLDELLAPVFGFLDTLPDRFAPRSAPADSLAWLAWSVGAPVEPGWDDALVRTAVETAAEYAAGAGTADALLNEARQLHGWELTLEEPGGVVLAGQTAPARFTGARAVRVVAQADTGADAEQRRRLARLVARHCPAHLGGRTEVAGAKTKGSAGQIPAAATPVLRQPAEPDHATEAPQQAGKLTVDPGSALIEVCTAIADELRQRLARVPEKHRLAALERVGVRPHPAAPARTEITFRLSAPAVTEVVVPAGTQVATAPTGGPPPVVFTTLTDARFHGCALLRSGVARDISWPGGVVTADLDPLGLPAPLKAGEGVLILARGLAPGQVLTLGVQVPKDNTAVTAGEWQAWHGAGWAPCSVVEDTTGGLTRSGQVTLRVPVCAPARTRLTGHSANAGPTRYDADLLRYALSGEAKRGLSVSALELRTPTTATVPAVQGELIDGEVLGVSDGTPGQRFSFAHPPLPEGWPIVVEVISGEGELTYWELVDTFADSGPASRHAMVSGGTGELAFGPRVTEPGGPRQYGAVPPSGAVIRVRRYLTGGGSAGNVPARALTVLRTPRPGVAAAWNENPATGGADPQPPSRAYRPPMGLPARWRAVTRQEYERVAVDAGAGVARAHCLPAGAMALLDPVGIQDSAQPSLTEVGFTLADDVRDRAGTVEIPRGTALEGKVVRLSREEVKVTVETSQSLRLGPETAELRPLPPLLEPPRVSERFLVGLPWDALSATAGVLVLRVRFDQITLLHEKDSATLAWEVWSGAWKHCHEHTLAVGKDKRTTVPAVISIPVKDFPGAGPVPPEAGPSPSRGHWLRCTVRKPAGIAFVVRQVAAVRARGVVNAIQVKRHGDIEVTIGGDGRVKSPLPTPWYGPPPVISTSAKGNWRVVESFLASGRNDRHVVIDRNTGQLYFGPELTEEDGTSVRCGARPAAGTALTVKHYTTTLGNLSEGPHFVDTQLTLLTSEHKTSVTARPAGCFTGGAHAHTRPRPTGDVHLLVIPAVTPDAIGRIAYDRLTPSPEVTEAVRRALRRVQPPGVTVTVGPPGYVWIQVRAVLEAEAHLPPAAHEGLRQAALSALYRYFSPLDGPHGAGRPLGRPVLLGEAYGELSRLPGVALVRTVTLHRVDPATHQAGDAVEKVVVGPYATVFSAGHAIGVVTAAPLGKGTGK